LIDVIFVILVLRLKYNVEREAAAQIHIKFARPLRKTDIFTPPCRGDAFF
jgi:hypothetical protein